MDLSQIPHPSGIRESDGQYIETILREQFWQINLKVVRQFQFADSDLDGGFPDRCDADGALLGRVRHEMLRAGSKSALALEKSNPGVCIHQIFQDEYSSKPSTGASKSAAMWNASPLAHPKMAFFLSCLTEWISATRFPCFVMKTPCPWATNSNIAEKWVFASNTPNSLIIEKI